MAQFQHIRAERDGPVFTITMNRPEVLNALNPLAHEEMAQAFDTFAADSSLRVAVLTGAGERSFCVGSDIKARAKVNRDEHPPTGFGGITRRFDLFKPVIASINGLALGGGMEMLLACDVAIAADHAEFGLPEPIVGLAALGGGGLQRIVRQIPMKQAMWLVLTGKRVTAKEALAMGLVNEIVPRAELAARTKAMAQDLLAGAPLALEVSKQVMVESLGYPDLKAAMAARYSLTEKMLKSEDAIEGQRAFAEKRKPQWRGR